MKAYSEPTTKGTFTEKQQQTGPVKEAGAAKGGSASTPDALLRRYEQLGKSLWLAMGVGILIFVWTIATFITGPTTLTEQTDPLDAESTTDSDLNQTTYDEPSDRNVEQRTVEATTDAESPPVDQTEQTNVTKPQQPARRTPSPATNKVQPEQQKTSEEKKPYEPADEQQNMKQQQQPQQQQQQAY